VKKARAAYREIVELGIRRGRQAMAIWQDLVGDHGFTAQYASVKRFVAPEAHLRNEDSLA